MNQSMTIQQKETTATIKRIFDKCSKVGEGVYNKIHIIDTSEIREEKEAFRIYHSGGHCIDVSREKVYTQDDEINYYEIGGYEYSFDGDSWDGFSPIDEEGTLYILRRLK